MLYSPSREARQVLQAPGNIVSAAIWEGDRLRKRFEAGCETGYEARCEADAFESSPKGGDAGNPQGDLQSVGLPLPPGLLLPQVV